MAGIKTVGKIWRKKWADAARIGVVVACVAGLMSWGTMSAQQVSFVPQERVLAIWNFDATASNDLSLDEVRGVPLELVGNTVIGQAGSGRSGIPGDRALNFGTTGDSSAQVTDANFISMLNQSNADHDALTVVFWQRWDAGIRNSSTVWFVSPSSSDFDRGFQAHVPWGDRNIYMDTSGCCNDPAHRLVISPEGVIPGWDWRAWHHVALVKNGGAREIWLNGQRIANTESGALPLFNDWTALLLGFQNGSPENVFRGRMDELAIFGVALDPAQIEALAGGLPPNSLALAPEDQPPKIVSLFPANGSVFQPPDTLIQFSVVTDVANEIHPSGIEVFLNDVNVTPLLVITGTSVQRDVVLELPLEINEVYSVVATATDTEGRSASVTWSFDTADPSSSVIHEPLVLSRLDALATQYPVGASNTPGAAIDGDPQTFSVTANSPGAFWSLELARPVRLSRIYLTAPNPADLAGTLEGVLVSVYNLTDQLVWETKIEEVGLGGTWFALLPSGIDGRIVRLSLASGEVNGAGDYRIGVAEVRLHGDPSAPLGPIATASVASTSQSSTNGSLGAELAMDGRLTTYSETTDALDSHWLLTLDRDRRVSRIEIVNRSGAAAARLGGLTLRMMNSEGVTRAMRRISNPSSGTSSSGAVWGFDVPAEASDVRYIRIGLEEGAVNDQGNRIVSLAEVIVYVGENLALNKDAYMVRLTDSLPPPENANDGNFSTLIETTNLTVDGYWETDLGSEHALEFVRVMAADPTVGRLQLGHATLRLFDAQHESVYERYLGDIGTDESVNLDVALPGPVNARYVRVGFERKERSSPSGSLEWHLRIREVQVFGRPVSEFGLTEFKAEPANVTTGTGSTLEWEHYGLRELTLFPDIGSVGRFTESNGKGAMEVSPETTTEYVLVGRHHTGRFVRFATVTVDGQSLPPRISEFVASNDFSLRDGFRNSPDWIELHNPNGHSLDLSGYGLSDNPSNRMKWRFPEGTVMAPHGFLIVFASGENIAADPAGYPHTNYNLSAGGESVVLTAPDGVTVLDSILNYPSQRSDLAYGRTLAGEWAFLEPTPGEINYTTAVEGWLEAPVFSHSRGFYEQPFTLTLSHPNADGELLYSLNGGEPNQVYTTPISVSGTTVVRATVRREGFRSPRVETHTYLYVDSVMTSPLMRTTYTQGALAPRLRAGLTQLPSICLSVSELPDDYIEREASIEIFMPDGTELIQANAGFRRKGGAWTTFAKKSYRVKFRAEYGMRKLKVPLFQGFDQGVPVVDDIDILDLTAGNHDMVDRGFYMANRFVEDTMLEMGSINPHGRFVHVYINGRYWGQYNAHERLDDAFLATYLGGEREDYVPVLGNDNIGDNFIPGTPEPPHRDSWEFVRAHRGSYADIKSRLDVPHLIDFMLLWFYGNSESEYRAAGPIEPGSGFKFWMADADGFLRTSALNLNRTSNPGPGGIFGALVQERHPDFMTLLADRIYRHMFNDGALTPDRNSARLDARMQEVRDSLIAECARWNYRSPTNWEEAAREIQTRLFPVRTSSLFAQLRARGMFPSFDPPQLSPLGGTVFAGQSVILNGGDGTLYHTLDGSDPRLPGGGVSASAIAGSGVVRVPLSADTQILSRLWKDGVWSALSVGEYDVVVDPLPDDFDWLIGVSVGEDAGGGRSLRLLYRQIVDDPLGRVVRVEYSNDLDEWYGVDPDWPADEMLIEVDAGNETETVTLRWDWPVESAMRFLRVRIGIE